jgi:transposase
VVQSPSRALDLQLPYMNPFPGPRSVLLLDNCSIHHTEEVMRVCLQAGVVLKYLEPYDPTSMPVEIAFRCMKQWLRHNRELISNQPAKVQIRLAMRAVGCRASWVAFHESGYL